MLASLVHVVREAVRDLGVPDPPRVVADTPATPDRGDIAFPTALALARDLRRPPRRIAESIAARLRERPEARAVEVAGPGYVNVFLDRERWLRSAVASRNAPDDDGLRIVEHTCINPNKAAHIGHLRNAALGDSFARILKFLGHRVEIQNYIDDTGVQVADVALGFVELRKLDADGVRNLAARPRFDYLCWDLYAEVSRWLAEDAGRAALRREALFGLEHGDSPWAEIGALVADRIALRHLETTERIGARYDVLPCEKTILRLRFWERAFELLKERGAIRRSDSGKNRGCWVMDTPLAQDGEKVIVRSNGTVTYVGKDIAYQMWQIGLLDREFRYRRFHAYPDGDAAWITTDGAGDREAPRFGSGAVVHHVIDTRQSYPQQIVQEAVARLTSEADRARTRHFAYEMVSLTQSTIRRLGIAAADAEGGGSVEVSGRKGVGVKADDFLDALIARAGEEVAKRNPDQDAATRNALARDIAVGALRYLMVKVTKNQIIVFDLDEALSFDGATGPYLQYAAVRARNILLRIGETPSDRAPDPLPDLDRRLAALPPEESADLWILMREAAALHAAATRAAEAEEPQVLARWAWEGAQRFNAFYHRYRIAGEPDRNARELRAHAVACFFAWHTRGLDLLGIPTPERM